MRGFAHVDDQLVQIDAEAAASEVPRLIKKIEREAMPPRHGKDLTKLLAALGRRNLQSRRSCNRHTLRARSAVPPMEFKKYAEFAWSDGCDHQAYPSRTKSSVIGSRDYRHVW
jgi:hypothetical protein